MSDFVVETRPRGLQLPPVVSPSGYVAEVRPSSRRRPCVEPTLKCSTRTSAKSFDDAIQNTEANFEMDVKNVLQNISYSHEEMTNWLHESVVKLINTLLSGHSVIKISGSINVSLAAKNQTISVNLDENYERPEVNSAFYNQSMSIHDGLTIKDNNFARTVSTGFNDDSLYPKDHSHTDNMSAPFKPVSTDMLEESPYHAMCTEKSGLPDDSISAYRRMSQGSDKSENDAESGYSSTSPRSPLSPPMDNMESHENLHADEPELEEPELVIDTRVSGVCEDDKTIDRVQLTPIFDATNAIGYDEYIDPDPQRPACTEQSSLHEVVSTLHDHNVMPAHTHTRNQEVDPDEMNNIPMDLSGDVKEVESETRNRKERKLDSLFPCKKCPAKLVESNAFSKHMLEFHKLHSCSTCFKDFSSKNNLKRHVRIHTGARPYKCGQCDMSFARKDDLKAHSLKHNFNKPFRCSICKKGYTDRACVKNHMLKEHCSRLMKICPQCGESFDREDAFLEHKQTHPDLKQFACETCPFVGTNHLMAMKHTLLHTHKLFSCKPCNAYFADPFDYTKHVRKHKKNKEYIFYVCCFCNCTLPTYEQFVRHEYSHAQGKLHECSFCKKQFKSKASMLEHALVHSVPDTPREKPQTEPDAIIQTEKTLKSATSESPMDLVNENSTPIYSHETPACNSVKTLEHLSECYSPTNISSTLNQKDAETRDSCLGELLDLSMKPPKTDNSSSSEEQSMVADQTEQKAMNGIFSRATPTVSTHCVPRNGYAAIVDTRVAEQEKPTHGISSVEGRTYSGTKDEEFQIVWQSPSFPLTEDNKAKTVDSDSLSNNNTGKPHHGLPHLPSQNIRVDGQKMISAINVNRYKPYSKMMEFATKFIAARGGPQNLLKDIGNTPSGILVRTTPIPIVPKREDMTLNKTVLPIRVKDAIKQEHTHIKDTTTSPISPHMIVGLTGRPCLDLNGKVSPVLKQELVENPIHPQTQNQHSTPSFIPQSLNPLRYPIPHQVPTTYTDMDTSSKGATLSNSTNKSDDSSSSSSSNKNDKTIRECDICNASFESFFQLESHSVVNHNRYLCEFCGKGFTARPNRDRHVRYHTGERPFKCDLCDCKFFRGDDLKYHRTTRHPMEQINCNRCTASFTWQKDLQRHLRHSKCVATA